MTRRGIGGAASPAAAGLVGLVLFACASEVTPFTAEPEPSVTAAEARDADEVIQAFLELMADPEVTYRVESNIEMGSDGPAVTIRGRYDVAADHYAGHVSGAAVRMENPSADLYLVTIDNKAHVWNSMTDVWTTVDGAVVMGPPTAVANLGHDDLLFVGRSADGLLEFDVRRSLLGDPMGSWARLGGFGEAEVPSTSVESHRTRLFLDPNGVPDELRSSWTFSTQGESRASVGSLVHRFSAFGLYVSIPEEIEMAPFVGTSHDVVVGVDDTQTIVREPWSDVAPPPDAPSAAIEVIVEYTGDEPLMLGIEGAILFVSSHDAAGALVLDGVVPFEGGEVVGPAGQQTLSAYYRTCSGNCSLLDPPTAFCTTDGRLEADARYDLKVVVTTARPLAAECILTADE